LIDIHYMEIRLFRNEEYVRKLMREKNLDFESFQKQLEDMVIKAVLSAAYPIGKRSKEVMHSRYNAFQFWALDFVIDENFRPYFLEFNAMPTMRTKAKGVPRGTVNDIKAKAQAGMYTVAGYQLPPTLSDVTKVKLKI